MRLGVALAVAVFSCATPPSEPAPVESSPAPPIAEAPPTTPLRVAVMPPPDPIGTPESVCDAAIRMITAEPEISKMLGDPTQGPGLLAKIREECLEETRRHAAEHPEVFAVWARCAHTSQKLKDMEACIEADPNGRPKPKPPSEAKANIARMFDGASAYFQEEHVRPNSGGQRLPHACPNDGKPHGRVGPTPPLSVRCVDNPSGRCVPVSKPSRPGEYDEKLWDDPVWQQLNFGHFGEHHFHYAFRWANDPKGYGACTFTTQAFGDLDGDGVWSTYQRVGSGDANGISAAAGLFVDHEGE